MVYILTSFHYILVGFALRTITNIQKGEMVKKDAVGKG